MFALSGKWPTATHASFLRGSFKAAYFNKDISGVKETNLAQSNMKALRGAEGATDLRKIVLPPAVGVENPDPVELRAATDLMGLDGSFDLDLETLHSELDELLSKRQIKAIDKRRQLLLNELDARGVLPAVG